MFVLRFFMFAFLKAILQLLKSCLLLSKAILQKPKSSLFLSKALLHCLPASSKRLKSWAALLWAKLMGTEVYEAGKGAPGVYLFAHNTKGREGGGITLLVINTNKKATTMNVPSNAEQYTLTAKELQDTTVQLNGQRLSLEADDELPSVKGKIINAGNVQLPSTSITFITFADTGK